MGATVAELNAVSKPQLVEVIEAQGAELALQDRKIGTLVRGLRERVTTTVSTAITLATCAGGAVLDAMTPEDSAVGPIVNGAVAAIAAGVSLYSDHPDRAEAAAAVARGAGCAALFPEVYGATKKWNQDRQAAA